MVAWKRQKTFAARRRYANLVRVCRKFYNDCMSARRRLATQVFTIDVAERSYSLGRGSNCHGKKKNAGARTIPVGRNAASRPNQHAGPISILPARCAAPFASVLSPQCHFLRRGKWVWKVNAD